MSTKHRGSRSSDPTYPDSLDTVPPATSPSEAVTRAEQYIEQIGSLEAFVDIAQLALCNGVPNPTPDQLDEVESRCWETWYHRQEHE